MDAHGRGREDDIDPADQWVFNPDTGDYELRLNISAGQSNIPGPRSAAGRRSPSAAPGPAVPDRPAPDRGAPGTTVPGQRRRRGVEAEPPPGGRRRSRGAAKKQSGRKRALIWTGGIMGFVLVAGSVTAYALYKHFDNNLTSVDVGTGGKDAFEPGKPIDILLIGTDKRTGKGNGGYGDKGSVGHADTNVLLHIAADRSNATALSIPRDLVTDVPDCTVKQSDGSDKVVPGTQKARFNTSLGQSERNPGCTMNTVKAITGVMPDHFMMADFNAVKTLTSAVGGVEVCVAKDVDDPDSHLKLSAGKHTVKGEQALAFVRTRHSFGNQGDLDRIKVQQQFLGSLVRKMSSGDTLSNPKKLYDLADAATKALVVDSGIGKISKLKDLALELKKVDPKNVTFATTPVLDNPDDGVVHKTVILNPSAAPRLFAMLRSDTSMTAQKKKQKAADAARLKGPKADPSEVRVDIYNGGAEAGAAQQTLTYLQNNEGVLKSTQLGNAAHNVRKTTLEYAPDQADQARRLADIMGIPGSQLKPGRSEKNDQGMPAMILTLGKDFQGPGTPIDGPAKAPEGIEKSTADKAECAK
ncbi:LCP family protein [Streptomyces sp. NPDC058045]|uniref:LCP family protein n=1 Tax=Streptomyces sp. NPDC058045 TaxID=3346311 RepID=UPI0036F1201D